MKTITILVIALIEFVACVPPDMPSGQITPQPYREILSPDITEFCSNQFNDCVQWTAKQGLSNAKFEKAVYECIDEVSECSG